MESDIAQIGLLAAFAAGAISFLSPCVLPLVPGYLSYVSGNSHLEAGAKRARRQVMALSLFFVFGFASVFMILGAGTSLLGEWLQQHRYETNLVGGAIIILFGLFMTGWIRLPFLQRDLRFFPDIKGGRPEAAYLLGVAFGFGWTPCIGPVLGAILTYAALNPGTQSGLVLLAFYAAGLALPFLLASLFMEQLMERLKGLRRWGHRLNQGAGVLLMVIGVAIMSGQLARFSTWMLQIAPWMTELG